MSVACWPTVGRQVTDSRIWEPLFTIAQRRSEISERVIISNLCSIPVLLI